MTMTRPLSVVLGNYPHTQFIKSAAGLASARFSFPDVAPVHTAFDDMVRTQRYDVCEIALATFLQARQAGKPLLLLPAVMVGNFHHANIVRAPLGPPLGPEALAGHRVGVRAYSTTMGLWARQLLTEEHGLDSADVTWVTTEGPHVAEAGEPDNVVRTEKPLRDALLAGELSAAILSAKENPDLTPVIADPAASSRGWFERHRTVPINHLVAVTESLVEQAPDVVAAVYAALTTGIDHAVRSAPTDPTNGLPTAIRYGRDNVRTAIEIAAEAAREQQLIAYPLSNVDDLFAL